MVAIGGTDSRLSTDGTTENGFARGEYRKHSYERCSSRRPRLCPTHGSWSPRRGHGMDFRSALASLGQLSERLTQPHLRGERRRRRPSLVTIAVSAVVTLGVLGPAALPASAAFQFQNDENGANDQPGQKDLTRHGVDTSGLPTSVGVTWNWDNTSLSGSNTGDGCALFDTDNDARVNFAVCVTIEGDPAIQSSLSPRLYTCGDDKVDRCTQPVGQIASFSTTCDVAQTATDPFPAGDDYP